MADAAAPSGPSTQTETNSGRGGASRGRGGRGAGGPKPQNGESGGARGNRERGGRGRGRGNRQRGNSQSNGRPQADGAERTGEIRNPAIRANFGARPAATKEGDNGTNGEENGEDVEAEVCFICASPVVHNSVAPCNHRTCHICSLRLRALYKTKACAHCRTSAETVIFTDDAVKRFEDFKPEDFSNEDSNLGIKYEKQEIFEDTVSLSRYNCPDENCDVACLGWPDSHRHVKSVHHKVMCDLCTRNKKVFTHEHELFTVAESRKHEKYGDDNPGAVDQSGFKGHPECGFCRQRFYGDDELFAHCRDRHERCHVCDRRNGGRNPQYYLDYNALETHFKKDHYLCADQECSEKKFVVFDSEMDLKAHQLEAHPNGITKGRDARRVDMSAFDYRAPHQTERPPRREGRGRGRGRDPNAEAIPASSAQPMRRDESAYQRSMAIQSAQSVTSRSFGGSLTQAEAARPAPNTREPPTVTAPRPAPPDPFPALGSLSISGSSSNVPSPRPQSPAQSSALLTPQEQARRTRHAAVTERAANLLGNDASKLNEFRNKISAYRVGAVKAPDLIDAFFSLFDTSSAELGKSIKELAEIFEVSGKRDQSLKAWADWRAINEDYPSSPGPSGTGASTAAGILGAGLGSSRVSKLKSSTAQSSRSSMGKQGGWGSANGNNPFPPIAAAARAAPARAKAGPSAAWVSSASSAANSARPSPTPSRASSTAPPPARDMFPASPPGKKPTSTVFSPGYTGAGVRRINAAGPSVSAWGGGVTSPPAVEEGDAEGAGKQKGRKGKKQVSFNWG